VNNRTVLKRTAQFAFMFSSSPSFMSAGDECRPHCGSGTMPGPHATSSPIKASTNIGSTASFAYLGVNFDERLASREFFLGDRLL
jgi:hypothetical protein